METKHTPGPWTYNASLADTGDKHTDVTGGKSEILEPVCIIPHDDITDEGYEVVKANARLIAAAPELYAALTAIVRSLADHDDEGFIEHAEQMVSARAALSKATGA